MPILASCIRPSGRCGRPGGGRAERYLLELLPRAEAEIQSEILQGLGRIGTAAGLPAIGRLASAGSDGLRIKALETLAQLKRPEAIPILEAQLKRKGRIFKTSEPLPIRLAAARALVSIGSQEAKRILEQVLREEPKGPSQESLRKTVASQDTWA